VYYIESEKVEHLHLPPLHFMVGSMFMYCRKTCTHFERGNLSYFKISGWNMAEDRLHT